MLSVPRSPTDELAATSCRIQNPASSPPRDGLAVARIQYRSVLTHNEKLADEERLTNSCYELQEPLSRFPYRSF